LAAKWQKHRDGELSIRSYQTIRDHLRPFVEAVTGPVAALTPQDFAKYRASLGSKKANTKVTTIHDIRTMFNWAVKDEVIEKQPRYGTRFEKPPQALLGTQRSEK